jgi:hypothetical protein
MTRSDTITKISPALLRAQRKIGAALKDAKNPFFKSNYATLGAVMEACKEHLNAEGISVLQPVMSDTTGQYVETILLHESGEFLTSQMRLLLGKEDMQAYGSAVSYARRYGLQSMVFIPAEDDDGEATVNRKTVTFSPAKTVPVKVTSSTTPLPTPIDVLPSEGVPSTPKRTTFRKPKTVPAVPETTTPVPTPTNGEAKSDGWE